MSKLGLKYIFGEEAAVQKERLYCWRAARRDEWVVEKRAGGGVGE